MYKIYKVEMICKNPSADCSGYFSSELEAKEAIAEKQKVVDAAPDYYGLADFYTTTVTVDGGLD